MLFVATTVNVYAVPLINPATVRDDAVPAPVAVNPPGEDVTVYPVMAAPPLFTGAVKDTVAWVLPGAAETLVGAPGTLAGVTGLDSVLAGELPMLFVATTVNV